MEMNDVARICIRIGLNIQFHGQRKSPTCYKTNTSNRVFQDLTAVHTICSSISSAPFDGRARGSINCSSSSSSGGEDAEAPTATVTTSSAPEPFLDSTMLST